jgi:hypothetical protein
MFVTLRTFIQTCSLEPGPTVTRHYINVTLEKRQTDLNGLVYLVLTVACEACFQHCGRISGFARLLNV